MRALALAASCLLGACQLLPERPARLIDPGAQTQASLAAVLKEATGRDIAVAADAFTRSSALYLNAKERQSVERRPQLGRVMVEPLRFDLVSLGTRCVVVDARNQKHYPLAGARCEAEVVE